MSSLFLSWVLNPIVRAGIVVMRSSYWLFVGGLFLSTGCSTYRSVENASAKAELPELTDSMIVDERFISDAPVAFWWQQLDDTVLGQLIERAIDANHDLRIAMSSLDESRAILLGSQLQYLPSVTAQTSSHREKISESLKSQSAETISQWYQTSLNASWELDLFGRINNQLKLSKAQLLASEADYYAVKISLAAEVASTYMRLRGIQQRMDIAERSADIQKQNLDVAQQFADVGRSSKFDVARARTQYELTSSRLPALEQAYQQAINRLSVLAVLTVDDVKKQLHEPQHLPSVPASVAVGHMTDLLKRRPDVAHAEQALMGAAAEYNIRVADLYPSVSLNGQFGYLSSEWSTLGQKSSETFQFSPVIHWAALDLTRVKSRIYAADARSQARLADFEKTVLIALEETNNAFTRFVLEEKRSKNLKSAMTASTEAAAIARQSYELGRGDLRDVLDAEQARLDAAQQLVDSEVSILLSLVDIYKNLGGGWELSSNPV